MYSTEEQADRLQGGLALADLPRRHPSHDSECHSIPNGLRVSKSGSLVDGHPWSWASAAWSQVEKLSSYTAV